MHMSPTYKYVLTFALFFCYFAYGVNFYVVGPTLIELAGLFQTTIERICLFYTVRSAGYTFGSLGGFLFKYINRQLIFVFFLTLMGVTLAFMPHCSSITQLFILAGINGFSIGAFDTAINVWILEIWQEGSGPFMQALHFTYGIGSFVAPLICEPFLSTEAIHSGHGGPASSSSQGNAKARVAPMDTSNFTTTTLSTSVQELNHGVVDPIDFLIYIPYAIAGAITVLSALVVLGLYYYKAYEPPTSSSKSSPDQKQQLKYKDQLDPPSLATRIKRSSPPCITIWLVGMGSLFLTFFVGMEQMHLQFLPTFVVNTDLEISPSTAAMMSSAAAFSFTVGRGLSIPLAITMQPQTILYSNHVLMLAGTMILAVYANTSETMMWVGNCILGIGFSSVYASIYAFLERQFRVTNRIGSVFVFAGGLTAALSPSLVGQYIEPNPLVLVWFNLICCLLCLIILVIIHITVFLIDRRQNDSKNVKTIPSEEFELERQIQLLAPLDGGARMSVALPSQHSLAA